MIKAKEMPADTSELRLCIFFCTISLTPPTSPAGLVFLLEPPCTGDGKVKVQSGWVCCLKSRRRHRWREDSGFECNADALNYGSVLLGSWGWGASLRAHLRGCGISGQIPRS